jgi:ferredoxin
MFGQRRSWGARTLAWASGGVLLLLLLVCGWTGFVMVWDAFGLQLAREGARLFDALPVLSEPTSRTFTGEQPVPTVFFFVNLFAHIGVPLAMGVAFWLHVKRLARPTLLPPRAVLWTTIGALATVAVLRPIGMTPEADPFTLPAVVPTDVFFAFWLPVTRRLDGGWALLAAVTSGAALLAVPLLTARRRRWAPPASTVDDALCTGCTQCAVDCPYGAIAMVDRPAPLPPLAQIDPSLCVSCGICAGSCAPMGVGPPGRTGRDQLAAARAFAASPDRRPGEIVVVSCEHAARTGAQAEARGVVYPVSCAGNLHSSVIELLIRSGAGGVLVMACPPRDCWNREGPRWLHERTYRGREAELQPRVDRARVRIAHAGAGEQRRARRLVEAFEADIAALAPVVGAGDDAGSEPDCTPVEPPRGGRRR